MLTESHDEEQIIARVAALDSGKAEVVCCVRVPAGTNAKKRLQEGPQTPLGGTVEHLDPNSLQLGDNVREYPNLTKPFLDSIAEHGVLSPITAIRRHDGIVEVRNGQRRIGAGTCAAESSERLRCRR